MLTFPDTPIPAYMSWLAPEPGVSLRDWQAGRCAMCGCCTRLVLDHDHLTSLTRGYLCSTCNMLEASGEHPGWLLWRAGMHPARLLGLERRYPRHRDVAPPSGTALLERYSSAIEAVSHLSA